MKPPPFDVIYVRIRNVVAGDDPPQEAIREIQLYRMVHRIASEQFVLTIDDLLTFQNIVSD